MKPSDIYESGDLIRFYETDAEGTNVQFEVRGPYNEPADVDSPVMVPYFFLDITQKTVHGDDNYVCLVVRENMLDKIRQMTDRMKAKLRTKEICN